MPTTQLPHSHILSRRLNYLTLSMDSFLFRPKSSSQNNCPSLFRSLFLLQQFGQGPISMGGMGIIIPTDVLLMDKDIGNTSLSRHLRQLILNLISIGHFVQFIGCHLHAGHARKELFGFNTIGTVGFGKDDHLMTRNFLINKAFRVISSIIGSHFVAHIKSSLCRVWCCSDGDGRGNLSSPKDAGCDRSCNNSWGKHQILSCSVSKTVFRYNELAACGLRMLGKLWRAIVPRHRHGRVCGIVSWRQ